MENLNLQQPHAVNGTQPPVIDLPAASMTPLPADAASSLAPLPVTYTPHTWADVAWRTIDGGASLGWFLWKLCKLAICVGLDLLDMVMVGWIGISPLFEIGSALICMALWGKRGWWGLTELAEFSELIDPWFPVCTLIAVKSWND